MNQKYTLTLTLDHGEELDKQIEEMLRARVLSTVRDTCKDFVEKIVEEELPRALMARVNAIPNWDIQRQINNAVSCLLFDEEYRNLFAESVSRIFNPENQIVYEMFAGIIKTQTAKRLEQVVQIDVVNAVISAITSKCIDS